MGGDARAPGSSVLRLCWEARGLSQSFVFAFDLLSADSGGFDLQTTPTNPIRGSEVEKTAQLLSFILTPLWQSLGVFLELLLSDSDLVLLGLGVVQSISNSSHNTI